MLISLPTVKCYPCKLLTLKRMLTKHTFEPPSLAIVRSSKVLLTVSAPLAVKYLTQEFIAQLTFIFHEVCAIDNRWH